MIIQVQTETFDPGAQLNALHAGQLGVGAIASFTGFVRDFNQGNTVNTLFLEHYAGMTEKALADIGMQAMQRWKLNNVQILHRVGLLQAGEAIVFVAACSAHRTDAFAACEFMMDYLKTRAPFWKKETTVEGERWVDARETDQLAAARWQTTED